MECKKCKKECLESELKSGLCKECQNEEAVKEEQKQEKEAKEQKENSEEKPYYKKWWFWILALFVLWGVILAASDSKNTTNTQISENTQNITNNAYIAPVEEKKEVTVADFSVMTQEQVKDWCNTNDVIYNIEEDYSDIVPVGGFISQSRVSNTTIYEGDIVTITYSLGKEPTMGEKNALDKAESYLNYMAFSYKGLIDQLEYEGFTTAEATYGVDNCGANWNEQAAKKAQSYIDTMSFSRSGLIDQLKYEGFTAEQAEYGVTAIGY